ncbi:MAG TPA: VOC family protein [Hyphomicrobiaceae bacterium]|jgi:catechol 2,3-dioxygenase-like lactoylglutathione lyase family enzyme|nr:VOC family protein [Hyphomicrobiaceae bacterium]
MAGLDHISLSVSDFPAARAFYSAALSPLGITVQMELSKEVTGGFDAAGFGAAGKPFFWVAGGGRTTPTTHIAFAAGNRAEVDAFYKAAIAAGARDNGPPGIRADYHPSYYGAFVLDADGNNIEAVCHKPE